MFERATVLSNCYGTHYVSIIQIMLNKSQFDSIQKKRCNGYEKYFYLSLSKLKHVKRKTRHEFTLVNKQNRLDVIKY